MKQHEIFTAPTARLEKRLTAIDNGAKLTYPREFDDISCELENREEGDERVRQAMGNA